MQSRFIAAFIIVAVAVGGLMYSASTATARVVVTVNELVATGAPRPHIRLGARLTDGEISYKTTPKMELRFSVRDIKDDKSTKSIPVVFLGPKPDTLQPGRDVILEGDFTGEEFKASNLLTQCPSKYEPPIPGTEDSEQGATS